MKQIKKLLLLIFIFNNYVYFSIGSVCASNNNVEDIMFSKPIAGKKGRLLVIKNKEGFIRKIVGGRFEYQKPKDGCYLFEDNSQICFQDGLVSDLTGNFHNIATDNKIQYSRSIDEFFYEKNSVCNKMKFDIINKVFVKKEKIEGFGMQLCLLDYFSIIRLFLYRENEEEGITAFIISDKNDVGCSPFYDYKIYEPITDDDGEKKTTKKKVIKANTQKEFMQKLAEESYKPMLLKEYTYLQPANNKDEANEIVLSIVDNEAKYINLISLSFKWKKIGFYDLFSAEGEQNNIDKDDEKTKKNKANNSKVKKSSKSKK